MGEWAVWPGKWAGVTLSLSSPVLRRSPLHRPSASSRSQTYKSARGPSVSYPCWQPFYISCYWFCNSMLLRRTVSALPLRHRLSYAHSPVAAHLGQTQHNTSRINRAAHFTSAMSTTTQPPPSSTDWSPDQYLLFGDARNRPIKDLITFLGPSFNPTTIIDLGCGPGNSTSLLAARFPGATISGMDSSPAMLDRARAALPNTTFTQADLSTYTPPPGTSLLFSNAVFHWLPSSLRIPTITRLLQSQQPGGVLAFQVPANYDEPSHRAMRATAASPGPWKRYFDEAGGPTAPALDPIEPEGVYYDALRPYCRAVEMWTTRYVHVLEDCGEVVEWVRGTGLQPFLKVLPEVWGVREAFLDAYRKRLEGAKGYEMEGGGRYERRGDGKVQLGYPRFFVVCYV